MATTLSIITPAYNEALNLPVLHARLTEALTSLGTQWEWIVVDDHSPDETWEVLQDLAARESRVKAVRLARNSGSHAALFCALQYAHGDCAIVLAADLQDPPETIPALLDKWRHGAQIVWAVRKEREGESATTKGFARIFYWFLHRFVGIADAPSTGADFFLIDCRVIDVLKVFKEANVSLVVLLMWMGFKQDRISYVKKARLHGRSGWSLEKKLKLAVDAVTSFTYKPIRFMSYAGFVVALAGFFYALVVVVNALVGKPSPGWSSLMIVLLLVGGLQMLMMGVLGEYVWRALDEARNRPRFIVEDEVGFSGNGAQGAKNDDQR